MGKLTFSIDWLPDPGDGSAFGPEKATWASFAIDVDGVSLTSNQPTGRVRGDIVGKAMVVGPLSGLVEWIVETWPYLLWEIPTPFPKHETGSMERTTRVPGLRDALTGWAGVAADVPREKLGPWQHRHSFGHGASQIALPSIVFVPEERSMVIALDHAPPELDPSVAFSGESVPRLFWLSKDDVVANLGAFVRDVAAHAAESGAGREWAHWIQDQWRGQALRASSPEFRRQLMYGDFIGKRWDSLQRQYGTSIESLAGLLLDSAVIESDQNLEPLRKAADFAQANGGGGESWRDFRVETPGAPPHSQGYELAQRARAKLRNPDRPIFDIAATLATFVTVRPPRIC